CYESKRDSVEKSIEKSAIQHYSRDDIWKYVTDIFVDDLTCANIISFMSECYVADLCYMVPKGCGQVKGIFQKLNEGLDEKSKLKKDDWIRFRNRVADTFLFDEIEAVNPEYIILHGNSARKYFSNKIPDKKEYLIEGSSYKIWEGILEIESKKYTVISIPHLKGIMKTMLWKNKKNDYEKYKSAKKILREIVKIN